MGLILARLFPLNEIKVKHRVENIFLKAEADAIC